MARVQVCVVLAVAALACGVCAKPNTLPRIYAAGSAFDVGHAIGTQFAAQIRAKAASSEALQEIREYVSTATGATAFQALLNNVKGTPMATYLDELKGVASGANVSVTTVQLLNMMDELGPLAHGAKWERVSACSDLLLQRSDGSVAIAHNEDGGLDNLGATYVVTSSVQGSAASFTAYSYPGELAGGAFGFNTLGVFFSTNAVFPKDISLKGVPRNFLQRYLLDAVNVSDAIHRATTTPLASGFSLNIGSYTEASRVYNVELNSAAFSVLPITTAGTYAHFNMYRRLTVPQYVDTSSVARLAEYEKLGPAHDVMGMKAVLGNTANTSWPIYRNGAPPDHDMTLVTAVFDTQHGGSVDQQPGLSFLMNNPLSCSPLMHMPFP